jgi:tetratricopeptide (TPR) repeat protein
MRAYAFEDSMLKVSLASALVLAASSLVVGEEPKAELHRGVEYQGAAAFVKLAEITVVYPAGPGEPVDLNRRSAEARGRWLAATHRSKVSVVADDQLSEEQKRGNLLILGWGNRIFGAPGPMRPFKHDKDGTTFMGLKERDPNVDLLIYHRNPLNWESFILFWSRIDPERDRFQFVPRVGSDWAMYRNYRPIRQGMFVPARVWPPARDIVAEADLTAESTMRPGGSATIDEGHYHATFDRAQFTDADVRAIIQAREAALAKAAAVVGPVPEGYKILLFLYPDEGAKQNGTGVPDPTHAIPAEREIDAVRGYALTPSPREEIHLLAREHYGPCFLSAIYEGLALSAETTLRGEELDAHAARLRAAGKLATVDEVLDEQRFRALSPESGSVAAAVFMKWLRETYGPTGVKKIYGLTDGSSRALAAALGTTESALTASFGQWADVRVAARRSELDFQNAEAEAQRKRVTSDWAGMTVALRKALQAKPGDPQTLFNLASAQMRDDDLPGAEASLKQLLAQKLAPTDSRFLVFGHYQLGRVYDIGGRRADALKEYDAVLALPDEHGAHELAQERKKSPATKEQLE